jgi:hypothetical protein
MNSEPRSRVRGVSAKTLSSQGYAVWYVNLATAISHALTYVLVSFRNNLGG